MQRTVPADKLAELQLPETYLETLIERMVRQVGTAMAADEGDGDVPV